jgi:hypothetical protein
MGCSCRDHALTLRRPVRRSDAATRPLMVPRGRCPPGWLGHDPAVGCRSRGKVAGWPRTASSPPGRKRGCRGELGTPVDSSGVAGSRWARCRWRTAARWRRPGCGHPRSACGTPAPRSRASACPTPMRWRTPDLIDGGSPCRLARRFRPFRGVVVVLEQAGHVGGSLSGGEALKLWYPGPIIQ